jgi:hypothetical protein
MATKRNSDSKVVISTGAAAPAPVRRKAAAPKRATRPAVEVSNTPVAVTAEPVIEVTNEAVAQLAYSYWEARGYQGGSPEEDWLRAEQELRAVTSK